MAEENSVLIDGLFGELVITRIFDAPRDLVFRAWTDPALVAKWWGPKGFTNPVCEIDARVGGAIRIVMRAPYGVDYPMRGVFQEVTPFERLVFTNFAVDAEDKPLLDLVTTVIFMEEGGKTKLTMKTLGNGLVPEAARMLQGMKQGWSESLDCLEELLANTM